MQLLRCEGEIFAELLSTARALKEQYRPGIITYSRKVFIPLTNLCRDYCGYCTYRRDPGEPGAHTMTPEEVLAVAKARDFDHALELANDSEYGLTGAVYTANKEKIRKAREQFFVGNLYINRKCTGAMVGAHPFGGFNMSGRDSKAGGPDYLLQFLQA